MACAIAGDRPPHVTAFCFPDSPANRAGEASDQLFSAAAQIECMPIKFSERVWGELKEFAPTNFKCFHRRCCAKRMSSISYQAHHFRIKDERFARIAKWKADAAAAGKRTSHFHQRNQRRQSTSAGKAEDRRADAYMSDEAPLPRHWCENNQHRDAKQQHGPKPVRGEDREPAFAMIGRSFSLP